MTVSVNRQARCLNVSSSEYLRMVIKHDLSVIENMRLKAKARLGLQHNDTYSM